MPPRMTRANALNFTKLTASPFFVISSDMSHLISDSELEVALSGLPGWSVENDQLVKRYQLGSFREAVAAIVRISFEAEDANHHPEITNAYNSLEIRLCTHDAGDKLTDKDLKLAAKIEEIVSPEKEG